MTIYSMSAPAVFPRLGELGADLASDLAADSVPDHQDILSPHHIATPEISDALSFADEAERTLMAGEAVDEGIALLTKAQAATGQLDIGSRLAMSNLSGAILVHAGCRLRLAGNDAAAGITAPIVREQLETAEEALQSARRDRTSLGNVAVATSIIGGTAEAMLPHGRSNEARLLVAEGHIALAGLFRQQGADVAYREARERLLDMTFLNRTRSLAGSLTAQPARLSKARDLVAASSADIRQSLR